MINLKRLTTEYIRSEDRIRIRGEIDDHASLTLWLTRPLTNLFVPHLIKLAEKKNLETSAASLTPTMAVVVQQFAQERALQQLTPSPAVQVKSNNIEWLVETVEIGGNESMTHLKFKPKEGSGFEVASVSFQQDQLRPWLQFLYKGYLQGEWGLNIWPEWIIGASGSRAGEVKTAH